MPGRGVITSAAVSQANLRLRSSSEAVSFSSTPVLADRRTRLDSSSAVRAPDSSSLGSMPIPRKTPLAITTPITVASGRDTANSMSAKGSQFPGRRRTRACAHGCGATIGAQRAHEITATASTSRRAPSRSPDTCTAVLAGGWCANLLARSAEYAG